MIIRRHALLLIMLTVFCGDSCRAAADAPTLVAHPRTVQLQEPLDSAQLLIDLHSADKSVRDATHLVSYESVTPDVATVSELGFVQAVAAGETTIRVMLDDQQLLIDVHVLNPAGRRAYDFENDVSPWLTRYGCNMSACHAKAGGQNGLQFSVFGFDPRADFEALVCSSRGRRVSRMAPGRSLFLLKATQAVPHVGGQRFPPDSDAHQALLNWVKAGASWRDDSAPRLSQLQISPGPRQVALNSSQQLQVTAVFDDGSLKDVTRLARYRSNNESLATVDQDGRITTAGVPGQVAVMAAYLGAVDTFQAYIPRATSISPWPELAESNAIDHLVHANLEKLQLLPSAAVSDADFLRRVYLDIIGTLPTSREARAFLADTDPQRRVQLVETLLERPEYADYWALKWADLLHVDRDTLGYRRAFAYYRWIRDAFAENRPLDEFARAVITAEGPLDESPQGSFYQAVEKPGARASSLSQVFLGIRIDCAECHHHPFDRWSQHDYYGMTAYFTGVTPQAATAGDRVVMETAMQTLHPRTGEVVSARPLGALTPPDHSKTDPRHQLAAWLTADDNPWFARNLANRTWAHFFGRGLVEPVDDVRLTNPASNSQLLEELADFLRTHDYDMKQLIRLITESQAYQRTAQPNSTNESDSRNASRALLKPLDAEVLLDAVSQTTGIPTEFDGALPGTRAIQLWDSKLQHPFLRLFGRPERKTACQCERASEPSVSQVLHIMNSPEIFGRLNHQAGTVSALVRDLPENDQLIEELYLTFLSRFPTDTEQQVAADYLLEHGTSRRDAAVDLAWSLMNTLEFTFNH